MKRWPFRQWWKSIITIKCLPNKVKKRGRIAGLQRVSLPLGSTGTRPPFVQTSYQVGGLRASHDARPHDARPPRARVVPSAFQTGFLRLFNNSCNRHARSAKNRQNTNAVENIQTPCCATCRGAR